ncbi:MULTISPECIES: TonB-dependent receptor [Methylobacterium]|nr:TonB-dependent receptor [Methylobacterium sp.]MBP32597.1 TonB-dependent receptor [Methylobacterium sp.]
MRALRGSLIASVALLPGIAHAQQSVTLGEISVVSTSPVGAGGGTSSAAQNLDNAAQIAPTLPVPAGAIRLRGSEQLLNKIPTTVETVTAQQFDIDRGTDSVAFTLARRTPGVNISDSQGNSNRVDITYRGFTASSAQGVPQGLAVYQNGTRINEAFGDIVNFDLIPPQAIQRIDVVTGNPVFGLNAIGGAVNIQMKNGFTWQGTEISAFGGSDARTAGYLEYGKVVDNWSFYFTGDGLNDRGWRYESPSTIGRLYADLGYRSQDSEFHLTGHAARSFFGAASATPVDFTHVDPRAIFTNPQTTTTEVGMLQLTGRVDLSQTWDLAGNAYFRRFSQGYRDGNQGNFENCSSRGSFRGFLCFQDDAFNVNAPPTSQVAARRAYANQFTIIGLNGQPIPFRSGVPYGTIDTTLNEATGYGGSLQAANHDKIFGLSNAFVIGGSVDAADYSFKSSSTLGAINPNLSVTTDPNNPYYGTIPGLGTPFLRTAGALGIAPSSVQGSNLYLGLYATDTLDVTDRLSLTAGFRLNYARIQTRDLTGFAPDVTGAHEYTKVNPLAGLTYRFDPAFNLYGSYSESNRAPTPLELSCASPTQPCLLPNSLVSDPPLKQVTGQTYEAGFRGVIPNFLQGGNLTWKAGVFRTDLTNDIYQVAVAGNAARAYFINVPSTRRQGIEVSGEYVVTPDLLVYANYALVDATFQFNQTLSSPNNPLANDDGSINVRKGDKIPLIPAHQIKAGFEYNITPNWRFGLNVSAFSSSYFRGDESNLNRKLPPYYVMNLTTKYQVTKNLEIFGLITNLTNNPYATFGTFAQPGAVAGNLSINDPRTTTLAQPLSIYAGLTYRFGPYPVPMAPEPLIRKY